MGSTPTSATAIPSVPSSSGQDACLTHRIAQVRVLPGRLSGPQVLWRHASVVGRRSGFDPRADLRSGREDGRLVQWEDAWLAPTRSGFDSPAGPLTSDRGAHGPTGRRRLREAEIRVRLPAGPFAVHHEGSWSNRRTPPWRGGGPGATPGGSTADRRKASEPASNPVASGAPLTGLWVRVPRLPLRRPGGETEITSRS